ncbi:MAG TPA: peptidase M15 [Bacteroidetes bacterium]|nr:peptidase M15 [Bacteroidota bacterium]
MKRKLFPFVLLLFFLVSFCAKEEPLVLVSDLDSTIVIDLPYASQNNFVGKVLYDTSLCYLRKSVAERLIRVQKRLQKQGLGLKIWDGYRPRPVQWTMWQLVPDPRYVADPKKGSRHNRGAAVDVTLVDSAGYELPMPTYFDDFSEKAHRDYQNLPENMIQNRGTLSAAMQAEGFIPLSSEWWHFDAPNWQTYSLLDILLKEVK